jgi:hypothetical protein
MRKRIAVKLAVTVAALTAMTLLQGCEGEEDGLTLRAAYTPVGYPWTLYNYYGYGSAGGSSQGTATGATSGGSSVASAISSAGGSSGGQVSGAGSY